MSPRTEQQYSEIREEKRQLIMDTALELFALNGYENTSISQISKKGQISKGLLYNYFESKEDLLENILNEGFNELLEIFDPNKDGFLEISEMEFFINELFNILQKKRVFWKLYWSVSMQISVFRFLEKRIDEMLMPMSRMMIDYFTRTGAKNPLMETILFGALMDGITLDYVMKPDSYPIEDIKKELIERFCHVKDREGHL